MDARPVSALALIPQGVSLVEREPQVAEWIDAQDDMVSLRQARTLLAAWRAHAERGAVERDAATRLDVRAERRIGQLLGPAQVRGGDTRSDHVTASHKEPAERQAVSRARALAAIPAETFDAVLAEPKPSRAKVLAAAVIPNPTVDPSADESARVHRLIRGPGPESWPHLFEVDLFNENAFRTIRETVETWRRWCDRWGAELDAADAPLRRVK